MIKPIGGYVLVEPLKRDVEEKHTSGLFLPATVDDPTERVSRGKVVAVGDAVESPSGRYPLRVKTGDIVVYDKCSDNLGVMVKDEGNSYLILREADIYGVVV